MVIAMANATDRPGAGSKMMMQPGEVQPLSVRFAVIGDFGTDNKAEADVAELVRKWNVDFVVTVGDNRYGRSMTYDRAVCQQLGVTQKPWAQLECFTDSSAAQRCGSLSAERPDELGMSSG